jgi:hypothetical protein
VRFGKGTGALKRQGLKARTLPLPLPLLTLTLLARCERVRERDIIRFGIKSPSSSRSPSEELAALPSPDSLPRSSSDSGSIGESDSESPVKPGGLDDPGARGIGTDAPNAGGEGDIDIIVE